jgi:hypothetical protein
MKNLDQRVKLVHLLIDCVVGDEDDSNRYLSARILGGLVKNFISTTSEVLLSQAFGVLMDLFKDAFKEEIQSLRNEKESNDSGVNAVSASSNYVKGTESIASLDLVGHSSRASESKFVKREGS